MQIITPHLWFDREAREAAEFYTSSFAENGFPDSRVTSLTTLHGTPSGDCDVLSFELAGQPFMAISAGPLFKFNPSVSFHVRCGSKEQVDALWAKLSPGGKVLMPLDSYPFSERYGWLADRYGLSWQLILHTGAEIKQKFMPMLMFVGNVYGKAEEAMGFYTEVFKDAPHAASSGGTNAAVFSRYGKGEEPDKEGAVRYAQFTLLGQQFGAMESAREHHFTFNEAISFLVPCDTQEEIDYFWSKLSADAKAEQCGWLKDKYGLSWQIAPSGMADWLGSPDRQRTARVTQAFLKMKKIDIAALQRAAAG